MHLDSFECVTLGEGSFGSLWDHTRRCVNPNKLGSRIWRCMVIAWPPNVSDVGAGTD
jgi:hypothetical protein